MDTVHQSLNHRAEGRLPRLEAGNAWPLGAHWDGAGVNFAVFSAHATAIEVCLFDAEGQQELSRLPLAARSGEVWHGRLAGAMPGLVYGLRAHGPWAPEQGHRFNPNKLLLDPCALEIVGRFDWADPHQGAADPFGQQPDPLDNATSALKARVVHDFFDWQGDRPPRIPLADTVLYELHVRGFTKQHPGVPEALRGTYAGLASDAAIEHLLRLGVTAVSLLPVHQFIDELRLGGLGLVNYWGYNSVGYCCPEPRYASAPGRPARDEFRAMVRRLHESDIEVVLDVVFNHTAEGDERGPTLSWRGLDNASHYRLPAGQRDRYENWSGCGNTLDIRHPRALQMVTDCLRYWVREMHVDGFRFDLAPVLGRGDQDFDAHSAFFVALAQDPVLAGVKLIAEPWDIGPGGYRLGQFPQGWLEWNDRFRDSMRAFWLGGDCTRGDFAQRLCASSDLFQPRQRAPAESVNFIVAHDGFTLRDLVSYDLRHNEANGEGNRDGHGHNLSWNCGHEGPTTDPEVLARRARLQRALLATLVLAQGTPMLAAGSEIGQSQHGNNNAYCQDNAISWLDWEQADTALMEFTSFLLALRRRLLPLGQRWTTGLPDAQGRPDLAWRRRNGLPLSAADWGNRSSRVLGALIGRPGHGSQPLLMLFNGGDEDAEFALPEGHWQPLLDSAEANGRSRWLPGGRHSFPLRARSVVLLGGT